MTTLNLPFSTTTTTLTWPPVRGNESATATMAKSGCLKIAYLAQRALTKTYTKLVSTYGGDQRASLVAVPFPQMTMQTRMALNPVEAPDPADL